MAGGMGASVCLLVAVNTASGDHSLVLFGMQVVFCTLILFFME
jgi:hypothetical protein